LSCTTSIAARIRSASEGPPKSVLIMMRAAMEVVHDKESDLENKLIAFDNFEQLIEEIDRVVLYRCPHTPGRHTSDLGFVVLEQLNKRLP
jgi:hypothetical protein